MIFLSQNLSVSFAGKEHLEINLIHFNCPSYFKFKTGDKTMAIAEITTQLLAA
jgi:hypothetical protein